MISTFVNKGDVFYSKPFAYLMDLDIGRYEMQTTKVYFLLFYFDSISHSNKIYLSNVEKLCSLSPNYSNYFEFFE